MLRGELVELRPMDRSSIDTFVRWLSDPEVTRTLHIHGTPITREAEEAWFEEASKATDAFTFAIHVIDDGTLVGTTGFHRVDWRNGFATFGILLGEKEWWGKGLGTDATRAMVRFAFEELGLHRVELEVFEYNERGIRAYTRVGFKEEGRRREALYREGRRWDVITMAILSSEWLAQPKDRTEKRRTRRPGTKPGGSRRPKR